MIDLQGLMAMCNTAKSSKTQPQPPPVRQASHCTESAPGISSTSFSLFWQMQMLTSVMQSSHCLLHIVQLTNKNCPPPPQKPCRFGTSCIVLVALYNRLQGPRPAGAVGGPRPAPGLPAGGAVRPRAALSPPASAAARPPAAAPARAAPK